MTKMTKCHQWFYLKVLKIIFVIKKVCLRLIHNHSFAFLNRILDSESFKRDVFHQILLPSLNRPRRVGFRCDQVYSIDKIMKNLGGFE